MYFYAKFKKIIWRIFPPETGVERFLRSWFHQIADSRLVISWRIRRSKASYPKWLHQQIIQKKQALHPSPVQPGLSFLMSAGKSQTSEVQITVTSLQNQGRNDWKLLLAIPGGQSNAKGFQVLNKNDGHIFIIPTDTLALEKLIGQSSGEFIVCCSPGDQFAQSAINDFCEVLDHRIEADVYYFDTDEREQIAAAPRPFFKPDRYSPELHLSVNFLSRSFIRRERTIQYLHLLNQGNDFLNQEWELLLLMAEHSSKIVHIPQVLAHLLQPAHENKTQAKILLSDHLSRIGLKEAEVKECSGSWRAIWHSPESSISIIIPTKNNVKVLSNLLTSIFQKTEYKNYEIILVDNHSDDSKTLTFYADIKKTHPVRIIDYQEKFNYSRAINLGASSSQADLLLFLNNDMEILDPDWLSELSRWARMPEIGVVGAKLLYADRTIQHAGSVIWMDGFINHLYLHAPDHYRGLLGSVDWYRDVSAVTGACQMMRHSVFDELGGYDEEYQLIFSDLDICLRALDKAYRIIYDPFAVLIHYEGRTRGLASPIKDILKTYESIEKRFKSGDPYFSPI